MNANINLFRPQVIEALQTLWRTLPLRGVSDERGTLEDYCYALAEFSPDAIWNTVNNLRRGVIEEASKDFCPKAPKLAEFVRAEQRRLDAIQRAPAISLKPAVTEGKRWDIIQRQRAKDLKAQGYTLGATEVSHGAMCNQARRGDFPVGTRWFGSLHEAWLPPQKEQGS